MSFPLRRYFAQPWGQEVPDIPQVLSQVTMAAGETHAGLHREVGGPRRPLRGSSLDARRRFESLVEGLSLHGMVPRNEVVVDSTAGGPDGLVFAGSSNGADVDHWWVGGDLKHAFRTAPFITLLVGAGSLRGRRRAVARTPESTVPLGRLTSGHVLKRMDERIESIGFGSKGHTLGTRESFSLLAGAVAQLVRALPTDGPAVRLRFRVPTVEHWLPLLPALHEDRVLPDVCTTWFERTRRDRFLFETGFTGLLAEMLGNDWHRVQVVSDDALHVVGKHLEAAVLRGERPVVADLLVSLRKTGGLWGSVLHPRTRAAIRRELEAEWRLGSEDPSDLEGLNGLVNMADVVNLMTYGREGLAIVVDEAGAARRMIGLAERFARRHPDEVPPMIAIGKQGKILGGTPGPYGPFARFRGNPRNMIVLDSGDPSQGKLVPSGDVFRELYYPYAA
ncbi:hypothetical protein [Spirillospora sp. CA-128828]|uniref:hypothetical protein n=1 Tax=Spirillospora sp. CA-128828 TaxID=3240033 RepID=UPI003D943B6E